MAALAGVLVDSGFELVYGGAHKGTMGVLADAVLERGGALVDVVQALNMTVPGVVAHQSALKGGERLKVPQYTL